MSREQDIVHLLRGAAVWLLALSVFFGPAGGGSVALAAFATTGEVSCPCEAPKAEHAGDHDSDRCDEDADASAADEDGDPCEDECPDGCLDCGCCLGITVAVLAQPLTSRAASRTCARTLTLVQTPASVSGSGVFRPPRSRT